MQAQERLEALIAATASSLRCSGSTTGSIIVPMTPSARMRTGLRS